MARTALFVCFLALLVPFNGKAGAAQSPPPDATEIFGAVRKAPLRDGIDAEQMVRIGGIDQWISVRGRHKSAPLLLFLHGGPGFTSIPTSYFFMSGWDEYFTVAQWEQRGAGKTFKANGEELIRPTMSIGRMIADAEEVITYLRSTYRQPKIVLVGHSWGTVLGATLAQRHPDWFYVYVGMAQFVDFQKSEAAGYEATLAAARKAHDPGAVAELEALAPFPDSKHPERNLQNLETERHWLDKFGGSVWLGSEDQYDAVGKLSPDYTYEERVERNRGLKFGLQILWGPLSTFSLLGKNHFGCPVVFMHGRHDLVTNASVLNQWYEKLDAPNKKLVWFEDSSHLVYEEEPGKTLVTLVEDVLPFARAAH